MTIWIKKLVDLKAQAVVVTDCEPPVMLSDA
jgi:hypothetical protein